MTLPLNDYTPAVVWHDRPTRDTPLNARNLTAEQQAMAAYARQVTTSYDAYVNATAIVTTAGNVITSVELCDATAAPFTRTLPSAIGLAATFTITATTTGTNLVTVATTGGQTIIAPGAAGVSTVTVGTPASGAPYLSVTVVSDGSNWRIV